MQSRRELLKGLIVSVGGATLLNSCNGVAGAFSSTAGKHRFFTEREMQLVTKLSDLILPRTDTPGAIDANVPGFIDGLMTEWANEDTRMSQRAALAEIDSQLNAAAGSDFLGLDDADAENTLRRYDARAYAGDSNQRSEAHGSYRALKGLIFRSFAASELGATGEMEYVAVPGRWDPRVPV